MGITLQFLRNDDRSFTVDGGTLGLVAATGLDQANVEVFTQKAAVGDGDIVTGSRVGSRTLEFTFKARHASINEVLRRAITSFFIAAQSYSIYVTRYGAKRYAADCRLDNAQISTDGQGVPVTVKLAFLMPEGYFRSVDSFGKNIAGIESRCGYPYAALQSYGRIYGLYAYAQIVYLDNDGDAEAYCKAVFTAQGTVVNPKLQTGNSYVRMLCTLSAGDVMVVDAKTRSVTLNGENASYLLDRQSSFDGIVFARGTNAVSFTADMGSNLLAVYVYYNKRYMGA